MNRRKKTGRAEVSLSFEQAMEELEHEIATLEKSDLTLEKALESFEAGITHMRTCASRLKKAEGTIKQLLKGDNGEFIEKELGIRAGDIIKEDENGDE